MHEYEYERPALAVDAIVMRHFNESEDRNSKTEILLIRRGREPFKGKWAFPGGYVEKDEEPDFACARELHEETRILIPCTDFKLHSVHGRPGRDPRGWVVSITYLIRLPTFVDATAGDDAAEVKWFDEDEPPPMAFDHRETFDGWWD